MTDCSECGLDKTKLHYRVPNIYEKNNSSVPVYADFHFFKNMILQE